MTPQEARNAYRREYRKNMTPDQRQREKEYNQRWRRDHPDLVRAAQVKYWTKKAAELSKTAAIPDNVEIRNTQITE